MDHMNSKTKIAVEMVKTLTPDQRREKLVELRAVVAELECTCPHEIVNRCGQAICNICGQDFNWWCEDSPDHVCHYYSSAHDGKVYVLLIDDSETDFQSTKDPEYESEDECLFCGQPRQRL